jgi:hypothetical protein
MDRITTRRVLRMKCLVLISLTAAAVTAGCAGSQTVPGGSLAERNLQSGGAAQPATCDAGIQLRIRKGGGTFGIPRCAGWKGVINYPPTLDNKYFTFGVTSSSTNDFGAPAPPSGTVLFYVQTADVGPRGREVGFKNTGVTNTVTSPAFVASHSYTLNVYNFLLDDQCPQVPCPVWTARIGSPTPGSHSITFSSPLNGASFGGAGYNPPVWQFVED